PRPRPYLYRPGFAGRQGALGQVERELWRLDRGSGAVVLVAGESGVGKTRFAIEVARRAARRDVRVLTGECLPQQGGASLHPLRRPLQRIADWCREWGQNKSEQILG